MNGDRYYRVNPANTSDIDPTPYVLGDRVTRWDGSTPYTVVGPAPEWDLYLAVQDDTATPTYETRIADVLNFSGSVLGPDGRVHETRQFQKWPIEDVYNSKSDDILEQDDEVRYGTADSSLSANWWIVVSMRARAEMSSIGNAQAAGNPYPGGGSIGPNTPRFAIYNVNTGRIRREQITESQYSTTTVDVALHDQAVGNATKASGDALDAAYDNGNGDWQAVADHDPADPAWQYPAQPAGAARFA